MNIIVNTFQINFFPPKKKKIIQRRIQCIYKFQLCITVSLWQHSIHSWKITLENNILWKTFYSPNSSILLLHFRQKLSKKIFSPFFLDITLKVSRIFSFFLWKKKIQIVNENKSSYPNSSHKYFQFFFQLFDNIISLNGTQFRSKRKKQRGIKQERIYIVIRYRSKKKWTQLIPSILRPPRKPLLMENIRRLEIDSIFLPFDLQFRRQTHHSVSLIYPQSRREIGTKPLPYQTRKFSIQGNVWILRKYYVDANRG